MAWLNKHPHSVRSAPGLEWALWRRLPRILAVGTALPLLVLGASWALSPDAPDGARDPASLRLEFIMVGIVVLHWTLVLTAAIGCAIVILMKGPTYTADSYPLPDADRPQP
ncbi:MAG: hypothetical protein AABZ19_02405 [Pseudomonadota bacterium]|jgi:hypothetical protein